MANHIPFILKTVDFYFDFSVIDEQIRENPNKQDKFLDESDMNQSLIFILHYPSKIKVTFWL